VDQDQVEVLGSQVLVGLLVSPDLRDQGENPDPRDHLDQVVHPEAKVFQVTPVALGHKAHLDFLDLQVEQDQLDSLDHRVQLVRVELQVQVVLQDPLEQLDSPDLLDKQVHPEVQGVPVSLASKDLQVDQEQQVHLDSRGPVDSPDSRDLLAKEVFQVITDLQEVLVALERWVFLVTMVSLVLLDHLGRGALLGRVEVLEALDRQVRLDHRAPEAPTANRASQDHSGLLARLDSPDNKDRRAIQGHLAILDLKVPLVQLETLDHQEALDLVERQDQQDPLVTLASLELRVQQGRLDQLDNQVP
jgi:hypothetical protein